MGETKQTAEPKKTKNVFKIILDVVIWIFVAFSVIVTILAFCAQANSNGVPSLFGSTVLTVNSESMKPVFNKGDIIIVKNLSEDEVKLLKEGDIITFNAGDLDGDQKDDLNTHRIVEVIKNEDGTMQFRTMGDNNNGIQDSTPVQPKNVVAQYNGTRIPAVGTFLAFLQTPNGFLVCIVLPLVLFFLYEIFNFVRAYISVKNAGKKQITEADEEIIKQKAIEEYLKKQQEEAEKAA